ncbi:maleylpyruvate isomerase N-terminal domain-containing protein [Nocardia pseudobrasiliensis]|uniref:maleylpyruvate isomerase N-terminal domain-containing protein n=1 Tax=Nocardia pseudobrasiliensis TaxID=45979 RepID=UPI000833BF66
MEFRRYLELILGDSNALLAAVRRDPSVPTPSCPGWTASTVLSHVGQVYEHKNLCMVLGREPPNLAAGTRFRSGRVVRRAPRRIAATADRTRPRAADVHLDALATLTARFGEETG